jgi:peptide/nickel transport system permease protein
VKILDALMTSLKRNLRRARQTWTLYKRSKIGLVGLGIMVVFFIMAIFAPIIAPYDPQFTAPNEDVFVADFATRSLDGTDTGMVIDARNETWHDPVRVLGESPNFNLRLITTYSYEGHAVKYNVDVVTSENVAVGIDLIQPSAFEIPKETIFMDYVYFGGTPFFATVANSTYYELDLGDFSEIRNHTITFVPEYLSNVWWINRTLAVADDIYCFVMANSSTISMVAKSMPRTQFGEPQRFFYDYVNVTHPSDNQTELSIVGDPIVIVDRLLDNGTLLLVPTDKTLIAYEIVVEESPLKTQTYSVSIGAPVWFRDYSELEANFTTTIIPVEKHTIAVENPDPTQTESKFKVVLASNQGGDLPGQLFSFLTFDNGATSWWTTIVVPGMSAPKIDGVHASDRQGVIVTATQSGLGLIAGISPDTGKIKNNLTEFSTVEGSIISSPHFVEGNRRYILTTDQHKVYMLNEDLKLEVVFSFEGGLQVPATEVGNIFTRYTQVGNYYAIVNNDGELFVQSLTGAYIAPLPPGTGKSGNHYLLGTDVFGHDIFTQLVYGTQNELAVGLTAAFIAVGIGTLMGLVAGYFGGIVDSILMRFTDIFLTLPVLVIALLLASVLGPSLLNLIIVISVFSWAGISRVIRAQTLSLKERDFIKAAKVSGAGHRQILFRHLAPNVLPFTFLYMAYTISGAIITEAILSFLGMGDPTSITWGMMLQYLRISGHTLDAPWWFLPPGIAITLLSLSFYLIGRAFDEVVNPRLRAR